MKKYLFLISMLVSGMSLAMEEPGLEKSILIGTPTQIVPGQNCALIRGSVSSDEIKLRGLFAELEKIEKSNEECEPEEALEILSRVFEETEILHGVGRLEGRPELGVLRDKIQECINLILAMDNRKFNLLVNKVH